MRAAVVQLISGTVSCKLGRAPMLLSLHKSISRGAVWPEFASILAFRLCLSLIRAAWCVRVYVCGVDV